MGVDPLHRPMFVPEHAPQAPLGWQAGAVAGHCESAAHGPHVCVDEHTGVVPEQFESVRHATQTCGDAVVRQYGVAPLQSPFCAHWSTKTLAVVDG